MANDTIPILDTAFPCPVVDSESHTTVVGGGGTVPRTYGDEDLRRYWLPDTPVPLKEGVRYQLVRYVHRNSVDIVLKEIPSSFPLRVPIYLLASRFNAAELGTLARLHNIKKHSRLCKDAILELFLDHHCGTCDNYVPVFVSTSVSIDLLNQSFRPEYIEKMASRVKPFSIDELSSVTELPTALKSFYVAGARFMGLRVLAADTEPRATSDSGIVSDRVPWLLLARKGPKDLAMQLAQLHGIALPSRSSKEAFVNELRSHACVCCKNFYALFEPVSPVKRVRAPKPPKPRPASYKPRAPRSHSPSLSERGSEDEFDFFDSLPIDDPPELAKFPPRPLTDMETFDIARDFCDGMQPPNFEEAGCAVCGQLKLQTELKPLRDIQDKLSVLREPHLARIERTNPADPIKFDDGPIVDKSCSSVCVSCSDTLRKGRRPVHALANGLWVGDVPDVLRKLTWIEQLLVARVRTNCFVVRLSLVTKGSGYVPGHVRMSSNAVAFAAPTPKVYQLLPPPREELDDVIAIFFTGIKPVDDELLADRTPYLCRRRAVADALEWLKLNHSDYSDLQIDRAALDAYPEHGIPVKVIFRKSTDNTGIIASATSLHDRHEEPGTDEGQCTFTVNGLVGSDLDTMSLDARKAYAVQHLHSGGRVLAVGHSDTPETIFNNHQLYPQIFPWLFPYGLGGLANPRTRGLISQTWHKKFLLLFHDKRFQVESRFLMLAFNHEQISDGTRSSFILANRSNFDSITSTLARINPAVIKSVANRLQSGERVRPETDEEKMCFQVMDQIDHVGGKVSGSLAGKKNMRNELWSLIAFAGAPSWFVTLSPTDNKHPISMYWADHDLKFSPDLKDYNERARLIAQNPVAGARLFHFMIQLFIRCMLRWGDPDGRCGLFGKTAAFYGTVEQQGRMTLHLHILLWISGAFSPQKVRDILMSEDSEFQRELIAYLEGCQLGEFMDNTMESLDLKLKPRGSFDPSLHLPVSPPSTECVNYESCSCADCGSLRRWRKSFRDTVDNIVWRCNVHECFDQRGLNKPSGKFKVHATGKGCRNKDGICTARFPREIYHLTTVDKDGRVYIRKREKWTNPITPVIVYGFACNTDTTSLGSGTAVKATVGYIADYIVKMGLKTYQIFNSIYDVFERQVSLVDGAKSGDGDAGRRLILKMANNLTSKIEIGGPMASMYLLGNPDHYTSHKFVPLYWKTYVNSVMRDWDIPSQAPELGSRALQSSFDSVGGPVQEVDTAVDVGVADDRVLISRAGGYFVSRSSVDDYRHRPDELDGVCLYEWVQCNYRGLLKNRPKQGAVPHYLYRPEHGLHHSHYISFDVRRRYRVVPTFISSFLPRADSDDRDYYSCAMLTLFAPWRTGRDLRRDTQSWTDAFDLFTFESRYLDIIDNLKIRYECYDARDDYQSQLNLRVQEEPDEDVEGLVEDGGADCLEDGIGEGDVVFPEDADAEGDLGEVALRRLKQMKDMEGVMLSAGWAIEGASQLDTPTTFKPERLLAPSKWKDILSNARKNILKSNAASESKGDERMDVDRDFTIVNDARVVDGAFLLGNFRIKDPVIKEHIEKVSSDWTLNEEQLRAYNMIAHHAVSINPQPLRMYIGGPGGTGKSSVLKALLEWFTERNERRRIVVLAPTGAAASVVNGSTYHSHLGVNTDGRRSRGEDGGPSLDAARERMKGVDYIFLDEVSMVSCQELYLIDARLKAITGVEDMPFGGISVIVAGDFAQLPPAGIGEPLYSGAVSKVQIPRQVQKDQEETLGMLIWHQFLVVILLTRNMRQSGKDPEDDRFRTMLQNLRYKDCTAADIIWLRSRIPAFNGSLSINAPRFRDVSIITARNCHKDQINTMNASRFAHERKMKLYYFYSIDRDSQDNSSRRKRLKSAKSTAPIRLTAEVQELLWQSEPHTSDHVPGRLAICLGMPVMIRYNEATELCVTKGQEGVVKGWTSKDIPGHPGRFALETLFVELVKPAKAVKLPYLPENIVPLTRRSHSVKALLPNDQGIVISRSQVPVLLNFAMTDYTSQGKTRSVNVVDLNYSQSHQAAYTALSRGTSARDTMIICDFNFRKLTGGLSGFLRQEFRDLEALSEITRLRYSGQLPPGIIGRLREPTLARYRAWLDKEGVRRNHTTVRVDNPVSLKRTVDEPLGDHSRPLKRAKVTPCTTSVNCPEQHAISPWKKSWTWDSKNWSCAYDSLFTILRFVWFGQVDFWGEEFLSWGPVSTALNSCFHQLEASSVTLAEVRSSIRNRLRANDPTTYPNGRIGTDVVALTQTVMGTPPNSSLSVRACERCGEVFEGLAYEGVGRYVIARHDSGLSFALPEYIGGLEGVVGTCNSCYGPLKLVKGPYPALMCVQLPRCVTQPGVALGSTIHLEAATYSLRGVIYHSEEHEHFTSRMVDSHGKVFTYDGMTARGVALYEATLADDRPDDWLSTSNGGVAVVAIYVRIHHVA